jgi:hypothetical protein
MVGITVRAAFASVTHGAQEVVGALLPSGVGGHVVLFIWLLLLAFSDMVD